MIDLSGIGSIKSYTHGGAGNDNITGGGDDDIQVGGGGNDHLSGGARSDMLIGSEGSDRLVGSSGDDILIGGLPHLQLTLPALRQIVAAWIASKPIPPTA